MNKRLLKNITASVLSVALLATGIDLPFVSSVVSAEETMSWTEFKEIIDNAPDGSVIELDYDVTGDRTVDPFVIPSGKRITINTNSHIISRHLSGEIENGYIFDVYGDLIFGDDRSLGVGMLTGGRSSSDAGAIYVHPEASLTVHDLQINDCKTSGRGGAIYSDGGNVYLIDGSIVGNEADRGGAVYINDATLEQKNFAIRDNKAISDVGGVYINGGYYKIGGKATVTGNVVGRSSSSEVTANVYPGSNPITILDGEDSLTNKAHIGLISRASDSVITSGFKKIYQDVDYSKIFEADIDGCIYLNDDHEVYYALHHLESDPVWEWADDYSSARLYATCEHCGEEIESVTADISAPAYDPDLGKVAFTATAQLHDTVYTDKKTVNVTHVDMAEPYVGNDGKYSLGHIEHYVYKNSADKYYFAVEDGHPGRIITDITLSYLDFDETSIKAYTGPLSGDTVSLTLPSSYGSDTFENLGGDSAFFGNASLAKATLTDSGSIKTVNTAAFSGISELVLFLNHNGTVSINGEFPNNKVTINCYHRSGLVTCDDYEVVYMDGHDYVVDDSATVWADDYSSARLTLRCSCGASVVLDSTDISMTEDPDDHSFDITASVEYGDKVYTSTLSDAPSRKVTLIHKIDSAVTPYTFYVPRSYTGGAFQSSAKFSFSALDLSSLTVPECSEFSKWTDGTTEYSHEDTVTLDSDTKEFTVVWKTVWAKVALALSPQITEGTEEVNIKLYSDLTPDTQDVYLSVAANVKATIDLNGFTIDRQLAAAVEDGYVFRVDGDLTLMNGTVTGGYNSGNGGAFYVTGKLLNMNMKVSGNHALNGGGIYLEEGTETAAGGNATMYCGEITDNHADQRGGGAYVSPYAGFVVTTLSSEINLESLTGGPSTVAVIEHNTAGIEGGGVYIRRNGTTSLSGRPQIVNNTSGTTEIVFDNIRPETGCSSGEITTMVILGALSDGSVIGFSVSQEDVLLAVVAIYALSSMGYKFIIQDKAKKSEDDDQRTECQHTPMRKATWHWDPDDYSSCDCSLTCELCGNIIYVRFGDMGGEDQVIKTVDEETKVTKYTAIAKDEKNRQYISTKDSDPFVVTLVNPVNSKTHTDLLPRNHDDRSPRTAWYDLAVPADLIVDLDPHYMPDHWKDEQGHRYELTTPGVAIKDNTRFLLESKQGHVITYYPNAQDATGSMAAEFVEHDHSYKTQEVCGYSRRLYSFKNWLVLAEGVAPEELDPGDSITSVKTDYQILAQWVSKWAKFADDIKLDKILSDCTLSEDLIATPDDTAIDVPSSRTRPLVIDLNGYKINRSNSEAVADGNSFTISGETTLKNGTLTGSKNLTGEGGAVIVNNNAKLTLEDITITGNSSTEGLGGALYVHSGAEVDIKGSIVINGNAGGNVYLESGAVLNVTGDINTDSRIYVTMQTPGVITSGLNGRGVAANFVSDDPRYSVAINEDGEAYLCYKVQFSRDTESPVDKTVNVPVNGEYTLPVCEYPIPEGMKFDSWSVRIGGADPVQKSENETFTVTANTLVTPSWAEDIPELKFHSVVLDGKIGVAFYMYLPGDIRDYSDSYMDFKLNNASGNRQKFRMEDAMEHVVTDEGNTYYGFICYLSSIEMADQIKAEFCYGDDQSIRYTYSLKEYVEYTEAHEEEFTQKELDLIYSLADLGHYMQIYFSKINGWVIGDQHDEMPAHSEITDQDIEDAVSKIDSYVNVYELGRDNLVSSLSFKSTTTYTVKYKAEPGSEADITAEVDGSPVSVTKSGDYYIIEITDIPADQLGEFFSVTFFADGVPVAKADLSPLAYVRGMLNWTAYTGDKEAMQKAMTTIYLYFAATIGYNEGDN